MTTLAARARSLLLPAVKAAAAGADRVRPPDRGVVVLIYHLVGTGSGRETDLDVGRFEEQVAAIAASGRACPLRDALAVLSSGAAPDRDPVVVTFDDGTADFADTAVPILVRHGVPATLYLSTAYVEEARPFPWGAHPASWGGLADAVATGLVDVGSHTHTHALLDRLAPAAAAEELDRSAGLIRDRLGVPCLDFAYPKAVPPSSQVDGAVRQRFRSAAVAGGHPNPYGTTDPHRLARTAIQASDGMRWFRSKLAGGLRLEETMRAALNRRRHADAVR